MEEQTLVKEMQVLYDKNEFEVCIALADEAVKSNPRNCKGYEYKGLSLFWLKRYEEAIPVMQEAIRLASPIIERNLWRRAAKALQVVKTSPEQAVEFWDGCNSEYERLFDVSRTSLLEGSYQEAMSCFVEVEGKVFSRDALSKIICCIELLSGENSSDKELESVLASVHQPKIVLVAGMGYSGSGAVFDYLSEFSKVTAVKGESPFISRGEYSLLTIYRCLRDTEALRVQLINFFYFNLLGFSKITSGLVLKTFASARSCSMGRYQSAHFDAVTNYCIIAKSLMQAAEVVDRRRIFSALSKLVVSKFAIAIDVPAGHFVVLDNVVPIEHIEVSRFLDNADVYCCFRDPRSNYVALLRENQSRQDVKRYIAGRGKALFTRREQVREAKGAQSGSCKVHEVQFEEFILVEQYRDSIAQSLGLDLSNRRKHSKFKPWESMRNIVLHQEHGDQGEIKLIEKELGEYCYEPCIRSLL